MHCKMSANRCFAMSYICNSKNTLFIAYRVSPVHITGLVVKKNKAHIHIPMHHNIIVPKKTDGAIGIVRENFLKV